MAIITLVTENIFPIAQSVIVTRPDTLHIEPVFQTLELTQSVEVVTTSPFTDHELILVQDVAVNKVLNQSVTSFLSLNSNGVRVKEFAVSNLLSLVQAAYKVLPEELAQTLTFTQSVAVTRGTLNTFTIVQTVVVNIVKVISITHTVAFDDGVTALLDNNWQFTGVFTPVDIADYDPSSLNLPPVPASPIPVQFIGGPYSLIFGNVDFGDSDVIEHTRINRRARGENLIVYRDPRWPRTETLKFKLTDLSASQGKSILEFINFNLAQQIKFSDWIGVRWIGVIVNPETQLVQPGRDLGCSGRYEIEIEFQGEQVGYTNNLTAGNTLTLSTSGAGVL